MQTRIRYVGLVLALTACACAGALATIVTITSIASEAVALVDTIADYVAQRPLDEQTKATIAKAVQKARETAIALQRAGRGAEHLSREQLEQAFVEFRGAYEALLALVEPFGVRGESLPDGRFGVDREGVLRVPPAEHFALPSS